MILLRYFLLRISTLIFSIVAHVYDLVSLCTNSEEDCFCNDFFIVLDEFIGL